MSDVFRSTKIIELGSCCFRQPTADSHCKFLHGYRLMAKFWFACSSLNKQNWVMDFGGLKELKNILQMQFDHTMVISNDDPLKQDFITLAQKGGCNLRLVDGVGIEKFAEWCFNTADKYIKQITDLRCWVTKVEVWEHENNSATYEKRA
jgi:6-pyruvoyltetrahydropterin/6-carboxytetrahydropterin synthase